MKDCSEIMIIYLNFKTIRFDRIQFTEMNYRLICCKAIFEH